jgi:fatty-acyl-CoA synthase
VISQPNTAATPEPPAGRTGAAPQAAAALGGLPPYRSHPFPLVGSNAFADIPRRSAARVPDKPALIDGDVTLTFREFDRLVDSVAAALQAEGLVQGDVLALLSRNNWQCVVMCYATARAGIVYAPINYLLSGEEVASILELVHPKAFVAEHHFAPMCDQAITQLQARDQAESRPATPMIRREIRREGQEPTPGWDSLQGWLEHAGTPAPVEVADDDVIRLMFTSGTEAGAKGVMLSSRALMWEYLHVIVAGRQEASDIDLHVMPLYHCAQLDCWLGPDLMLGATSILIPSAGAARILGAIEKFGANKMYATPSKWIELIHSPAFTPARMASMRKAFYGGAPIPVPTLEEIAELLPDMGLFNFYGQTEMAPCATILPPEDQISHAGSAGLPGLTTRMAILDADCQELPAGEVGEIAFRSAQACLGYWQDPKGTQELFRGGWLHTGDRGYVSDTGYLYYVDRVKDTVNVGGEKVASREVEEVIYEMDQVLEAAVIGVPERRFGEMVVAVVSPRPGREVTPDDVIAHVRGRLAGFKVPRRVVVEETLPKNPSGKILKRELRERYKDIALA